MDKSEMMKALEETSEALEIALGRLGCCGNGDGKDHKADVDDYGGMELCARNKELLKKIRNNNIPYVTEAKAEAYDRLMSGGKKTLKEWANWLGMNIAVDENGNGCVSKSHLEFHQLCDGYKVAGFWTIRDGYSYIMFNIPFYLIDYSGDWKDSLTLPDRWETKGENT